MMNNHNIYDVSYVYVNDRSIKLPAIDIEASDIVRACILAEKRIEIDTQKSYEIISIVKYNRSPVREKHLDIVREIESKDNSNNVISPGGKHGRPRKT
jgi:hypothetical protein